MKLVFPLFATSFFYFITSAVADFSDKPSPVQPPATPTGQRPSQQNEEQQAAPQQPLVTPKPKSTKSNSTNKNPIQHNTTAPIIYKADSANGSNKNGVVELIKNVIIKQDATTLWADKADLYTEPGTTSPKRIVARGKVKLKKEATAQSVEMNATAQEIEYFANTQKAILRGKPVIQKGKEVLRGELIEVDLITESIKVRNPSGVMDPKSNSVETNTSQKGQKK